jgi:hypothetical protein
LSAWWAGVWGVVGVWGVGGWGGGGGGGGGGESVKPKIFLRTYVYKRASTGSSANLFAAVVCAKIIAKGKYRKKLAE